jgi:hypothetical protein
MKETLVLSVLTRLFFLTRRKKFRKEKAGSRGRVLEENEHV